MSKPSGTILETALVVAVAALAALLTATCLVAWVEWLFGNTFAEVLRLALAN